MRARQLSPGRLIPRPAVLPLVAAVALTTFACGLDKLTAPPKTAAEQLNAKIVAPTVGDSVLAMGATLQLTISTDHGTLDNSVAQVRWTSDKPTIAKVDSVTGIITGIGLGSATLSASVTGADFGVVPAAAFKIRVKYAGISIK